jgi:hypothetical protein
MGNKNNRNAKMPEPIEALTAEVRVGEQDLQAMFNAMPAARFLAENFALRRMVAERDAEILELTKRLKVNAGS